MLGYSKKDLLLFRKVHVMGLERQLSEAPGDPALLADCEFLSQSGYLISAPDLPVDLGNFVDSRTKDYFGHDVEAILEHTPESRRLISQLFRHASGARHPRLGHDALPPGAEFAVAFLLTETGQRCVPIARHLPTARQWRAIVDSLVLPDRLAGPPTGDTLVELVIDHLPVPGEDIPLDAILDFVNDPETRRKRDRLDTWTRRAAQSGRELQDIGLEMEESLHDFADHMRLADMRSRTSGMRIALSLPLGVIEELLHLRPRKAADVVFEYRDRKANRLEAELAAPGGALAYIYEAERLFGSSGGNT